MRMRERKRYAKEALRHIDEAMTCICAGIIGIDDSIFMDMFDLQEKIRVFITDSSPASESNVTAGSEPRPERE